MRYFAAIALALAGCAARVPPITAADVYARCAHNLADATGAWDTPPHSELRTQIALQCQQQAHEYALEQQAAADQDRAAQRAVAVGALWNRAFGR